MPTHGFSSFYAFSLLPDPAGEGVSECLRGTWLLVGVKPQKQENLPEGQEVKFRNLWILVSTIAQKL